MNNLGLDITKQGAIKSKYLRYTAAREPVLRRARECAELTIPSLLPPQEDNTQSLVLPTPHQSLGAEGVNNLANKLLLTLLPPNTPFFRYRVDDVTLQELGALRTDVEASLSGLEKAVMDWIETSNLRTATFRSLKLLIVTGNSLEYYPPKGGMKVYRLDQYVVKRDPMGNVIEIIVKEKIHPEALPMELQEQIKTTDRPEQNNVEIYTYIYLVNQKWCVEQEVNGIPYLDGAGTYALNQCPWLVHRWNAVDDEDYGRGLVEEHLGYLRLLEGIYKGFGDYAAASSKVVFLVNPNGTTNAKKLAKAKSGDFVEGKPEDVACLQVEKTQDMSINMQVAEDIKRSLSKTFMLMSSIQRDAERVSAEEIRQMAKDIEDSLGGNYSMQAQERQLPLVRFAEAALRRQRKFPKLPKNIVKPMIVTGLEALGRANDLNKLNTWMSFLAQVPGAAERAKLSNIMTTVGTNLGLDTKEFMYSEEEYQQMQQNQQLMTMAQQVAPGVAQEMTKGVMQPNEGGQQ